MLAGQELGGSYLWDQHAPPCPHLITHTNCNHSLQPLHLHYTGCTQYYTSLHTNSNHSAHYAHRLLPLHIAQCTGYTQYLNTSTLSMLNTINYTAYLIHTPHNTELDFTAPHCHNNNVFVFFTGVHSTFFWMAFVFLNHVIVPKNLRWY